MDQGVSPRVEKTLEKRLQPWRRLASPGGAHSGAVVPGASSDPRPRGAQAGGSVPTHALRLAARRPGRSRQLGSGGSGPGAGLGCRGNKGALFCAANSTEVARVHGGAPGPAPLREAFGSLQGAPFSPALSLTL